MVSLLWKLTQKWESWKVGLLFFEKKINISFSYHLVWSAYDKYLRFAVVVGQKN